MKKSMKKSIFGLVLCLGAIVLVGASCIDINTNESTKATNKNVNEDMNINESINENVNTNEVVNENKNINETVSKNVNENVNKNINEEKTSTGYTSYTYSFFTFNIPDTWIAETQDHLPNGGNEKVKFYDANNNEVALLTCPYVVTGYPGCTTTSDIKKVYGNGYEARLMIKDCSAESDLKNTGLLIMERDEFNSCQLFSMNDILTFNEINTYYQDIYQAL